MSSRRTVATRAYRARGRRSRSSARTHGSKAQRSRQSAARAMTVLPSQSSAECHSLCAGRRGAPLLSPLDRPSASYRKACQRIPRLKLILVAPAAKQTADPTEGPRAPERRSKSSKQSWWPLHQVRQLAPRLQRGHEFHISLRFTQFTAERCHSLAASPPSRGDRALSSTMTHSTAIWRNAATAQFLPCQGWGRGFESLRPLQFSRQYEAAEFRDFFAFGRLKSQPVECRWRTRVTSGSQVRQIGDA